MADTNEIVLNEMQKRISVRDIVLVRSKIDEVGQPYLITFAEPNDSFMAAIRILPSKSKNDLTISPTYFNNPKTANYNNGGYVNVYTGINTIRRHNVTTTIGSLDNETYVKIIYAMFGGMLGYYSTNGRFHLPSHIPLTFSINVNLLGALKNSGIKQKNGEIYTPPVKQPAESAPSKPRNAAAINAVQNATQAEPTPDADVSEVVEEQATSDDDSWNEPPANIPDPIVVEMIFGSSDENIGITIQESLARNFGLDSKKYDIISVGPIEIYQDEFIEILVFGKFNLAAIFAENSLTVKATKSLEQSLITFCKDLYEAAKSKIS